MSDHSSHPSSRTPHPSDTDWVVLYQSHAARVRRIAVETVGDASADDVVQETFLRAYRNRASFEAGRPVGPWLCAIARRAAIDALRRERAGRRLDQSIAPPPLVDAPVEDALFNGIRRLGIAQSFRGLNEQHRRVLAGAELARGDPGHDERLRSVLARARRNFRERYLDFARDSGVFGAGGIVRRLSTRLRGWAASSRTIPGESVAVVVAVCADALVASGPSRSLQGRRAATRHASSVNAGHPVDASAGPTGPLVHVSLDPTVGKHSVAIAGNLQVAPGTPTRRPVEADVGWWIGTDGDTAGISIATTVHTPVQSRTTWFDYQSDCEVGSGPIECEAWRAMPEDRRHEDIEVGTR